MCGALAVLHALDHRYYGGLVWLVLGTGLALRAWLRPGRWAYTLLVGGMLALVVLPGWQQFRARQQLCALCVAPCAVPQVPGLRTVARVVRAGQLLAHSVAALLY